MKTSPSFQERFEQFALISLEKQSKLESLIADQTHELDLDGGRILFAGREIPMQVLGTESDNTLTWLWAWAEEQTEIPEQLLDASLRMRSWGSSANIPEFTIPSLDLDRTDGFALSLVASQICNASCHFRDVYEGGALYLLLFDREIDNLSPYDRSGLVRAMTNLFSRYEMNQRNALLSYIKLKGHALTERDGVLSVELETRERLVAEFDARDKLVVINGTPFAPQD